MAGDRIRRRLGDLVAVRHGFAFQGEYFRDEPTSLVLVTPGNFEIGGGFKADKPKFYEGPVPEAFLLEAGDLIVTMTDLSKGGDTLGFPAIVPRSPRVRYLHNQRIGRVEVTARQDLDKGYLYYLLCSDPYRHEVLASATGSTVRHTSPSRIGAFTFEAPPLTEQKATADALRALDDKINLNRRTNATLEALARALFKSWFVDFDPVHDKADGRAPAGMDAVTATLFANGFEKSEMGEVPRGWRTGTVGTIANVVDCLHSKKPERRGTGRPFLQLSNILGNGMLDLSEIFLVSEDDYALWTSKFEASPGDCVITNVGRVGAVAQVPTGFTGALGRNMTGVRCKPEAPYPTFLVEALLSEAMRDEVVRKTDTGTILDALNVRNIPRLRLALPTTSIMSKFEGVARPLRARMEVNHQESLTLASLRNALLPKLLSGELRVRDAEKAVEQLA